MNRRGFLKTTALASASTVLVRGQLAAQILSIKQIAVRSLAADSIKTRLTVRELITGLRSLHAADEIIQATENSSALMLTLIIDSTRFKGEEEYEIARTDQGATLTAANDQTLLYAVFEFLERQGMVFGIDGATAPIDRIPSLLLPEKGHPWTASPVFALRGLLPWPDFFNCISTYNDEDFKAYFANMMRMRLNLFGMHVYTQNDPGPMAESYLSFDYAGSGHRSGLEDTTATSWGYLPQRTSTYKMGADRFFDTDTFGSDAMRNGRDTWEIARNTTTMLQTGFNFARELGIRTGIGFEPYQNPAEINRALPPEALNYPGGFIESRTARDLLERRLADLLERYPMIDDVWLWQDEHANWQSRKTNIPLSVTPFMQAHQFLQRHAPNKKLVVAGWGGVTRHFESLHQRLPEDIIFSALSDTLGWDPVSEAFSKLGNRERWPIPWLEDDQSMWFPQFRASRFESDMKRAKDFGCQGMLSIHWRHRIVDPTATYFSRAAWDRTLTASAHYKNFCVTQASGPHVEKLANIFDKCDSGHAISSTFLGGYDENGFANVAELAGDYDEGFNYARLEPNLAVFPTQHAISERIDQLTAEATTPLEKNRIGYFAGFIGFMVSYCDAFENAHKLDAVLKQAVDLRAANKQDEARKEVLDNGVPLWLSLAPQVREAMLRFQNIIATRNDLGQLASMQNKFVRITLERLRLSIQEFVGDLPPEMEKAYAAAITPVNSTLPRIFIPTRPSLIQPGEELRLFINAPGIAVGSDVKLLTRRQGSQQWKVQLATHAGRDVYSAQLGPFDAGAQSIEYYATVKELTDPPQAPENLYTVDLIA